MTLMATECIRWWRMKRDHVVVDIHRPYKSRSRPYFFTIIVICGLPGGAGRGLSRAFAVVFFYFLLRRTRLDVFIVRRGEVPHWKKITPIPPTDNWYYDGIGKITAVFAAAFDLQRRQPFQRPDTLNEIFSRRMKTTTTTTTTMMMIMVMRMWMVMMMMMMHLRRVAPHHRIHGERPGRTRP